VNEQQQPVEIPAESIVNYLLNRVAQLTVELELSRATVSYLTTAPDTVPAPAITEP
jgi:hypothetical protein